MTSDDPRTAGIERSQQAHAELLRERVLRASSELGSFGSVDPEAVVAMRAVRLTRLTLECFWLPAIERVTA